MNAIKTMIEVKIRVLSKMPENNFAYGQTLGFLEAAYIAVMITDDEYETYHNEIQKIERDWYNS